jgi:hypothetical protein
MSDLERIEQKLDRLLSHLGVDRLPRWSHTELDERAKMKAPAILLKFEQKGVARNVGSEKTRKKLAD